MLRWYHYIVVYNCRRVSVSDLFFVMQNPVVRAVPIPRDGRWRCGGVGEGATGGEGAKGERGLGRAVGKVA